MIFNALASLRLTVWLLAMSLLVVFFGTLDQVQWGIRHAQAIYFESVIAWTPVISLLELMVTRNYGTEAAWFKLPLPGGYTLGALLVVNLCAAHFRHYKVGWRHAGITIIHGGVVLLLISGFLISALQKESRMWITEGGSSQYSSSFYDNELVLIDTSAADFDTVYSIPEAQLADGAVVALPGTAFTLHVLDYMPNASVFAAGDNPDAPMTAADRGAAARMGLTADEQPRVFQENRVNAATAVVEVRHEDAVVGTWLVSNVMDDGRIPPQTFTLPTDNGEASYAIALRFTRTYYPFRLELLDFTHEKYPGTDIPKNFSSEVRLVDPENGVDRTTLIFMNNPLRYDGHTFYQASFSPDDTSSMLQVVDNPAATVPYVAVALVGLGMCLHFAMKLWKHLGRSRRVAIQQTETPAAV